MKLTGITIRDPFILLYESKYYLYGTRSHLCWKKPDDIDSQGFDVYVSEDLENWSEPIEVFKRPEGFWADQNFWAPEVHVYKDEFYLFATFIGENRNRGTQILKAQQPIGPFIVHSPPITPANWSCLDGTLYVDKVGKPHLIFCHEWVQIKAGTICVIELSEDLTYPVSEPRELIKASDPSWAGVDAKRYVTDGPFLYRTQTDQLLMFWSSMKAGNYVQALARSSNKEIGGKWEHFDELLYATDGGHGMAFKTKTGKLYFTLHAPNINYHEHPCLLKLKDVGSHVVRIDEDM